MLHNFFRVEEFEYFLEFFDQIPIFFLLFIQFQILLVEMGFMRSLHLPLVFEHIIYLLFLFGEFGFEFVLVFGKLTEFELMSLFEFVVVFFHILNFIFELLDLVVIFGQFDITLLLHHLHLII